MKSKIIARITWGQLVADTARDQTLFLRAQDRKAKRNAEGRERYKHMTRKQRVHAQRERFRYHVADAAPKRGALAARVQRWPFQRLRHDWLRTRRHRAQEASDFLDWFGEHSGALTFGDYPDRLGCLKLKVREQVLAQEFARRKVAVNISAQQIEQHAKQLDSTYL